jgi:hypothetical protein
VAIPKEEYRLVQWFPKFPGDPGNVYVTVTLKFDVLIKIIAELL